MANHNEVAHAWAHQTGRARKGFNMFYEGGTIYSYGRHFAIARIVDHGDAPGGRLFLVTSRGYSISTGKHITYTRRAIPAGAMVLYVNDPEDRHQARNIEHLIREAGESVESATRRRKPELRASDISTAEHKLSTARMLAAMFPDEHLPAIPANADAIPAVLQAEREALAAKRREDAKRQALAARTSIRAWLQGVTGLRPAHTANPYIRVVGDRVQTSWGVEAPLALALRVFRKAQDCRRLHKPANLGAFLGYGDATIEPSGDIRVGCHHIRYRIAQLAACRAGLLNPA